MKLFAIVLFACFAFGTQNLLAGVPPSADTIRNCSRVMCENIRNCSGGVDLRQNSKTTKSDKSAKTSENTQGIPGGFSCYDNAYFSFFQCMFGGNPLPLTNSITPYKSVNVSATAGSQAK